MFANHLILPSMLHSRRRVCSSSDITHQYVSYLSLCVCVLVLNLLIWHGYYILHNICILVATHFKQPKLVTLEWIYPSWHDSTVSSRK
jgi:hypothetical protein